MFDLLSGYKGRHIAVDLTNGKQLAGTVIEVGRQDLRMETDQGVCIILISAIQAVWEKPSSFQSLAEDQNIQPDLEQVCTLLHGRPCAQVYGQQPCTQAYMQPCYQMYGMPCTQAYTGGCPQAFMPHQYEDPCFRRFGAPCYHMYAQSEPYGDPRYGRYGRFGRGCWAVFGGGGFPLPLPYPYPPYPYPPYPYPPYPYPPYPYSDEQASEEMAQQTQDEAGKKAQE